MASLGTFLVVYHRYLTENAHFRAYHQQVWSGRPLNIWEQIDFNWLNDALATPAFLGMVLLLTLPLVLGFLIASKRATAHRTVMRIWKGFLQGSVVASVVLLLVFELANAHEGAMNVVLPSVISPLGNLLSVLSRVLYRVTGIELGDRLLVLTSSTPDRGDVVAVVASGIVCLLAIRVLFKKFARGSDTSRDQRQAIGDKGQIWQRLNERLPRSYWFNGLVIIALGLGFYGAGLMPGPHAAWA